jgi:hypothetical protein
VAIELVAELIGAPLLEALRRRRPRLAARAESAVEWLRDAAEPPHGVKLVAEDGSVYTGLVIIERNAPVVMLAVRHPAIRVERPPIVTPPPAQQRLYGHDRLDPDDPIWDRDMSPYSAGRYGR